MRKYITCLVVFLFGIQLYSQDSLNMEKVGQWNPPGMPVHNGVIFNDVWGYTASDGSEYGIIGNVDSIVIVNVTNPASPTREFAHYGGGHAIWRDFKVFQDHLYAVCDGCSEGMHIFDLSGLPGGSVTHVETTTEFFSKAHNIYIDTSTQKLYAAGTNTANKGLVVIDISTPDDPVHIDDYLFEGPSNYYVHDLYVKNDTAYCSHGNTGYYVWDMTDLNAVELLGSYDSPGYNHSSWNHSSGTYSYYAEEVPLGRPMAVMDLTNLGSTVNDIQLLTTFKHPISNTALNVTPHNPFVRNDSLFISYYEDGLKVYDLVDPTDPNLVGYYDTYTDNGSVYTGYEGAWGCYPFLPSGVVLISDITYGLNIIKMQTCANPTTYYRDRDQDGYGDPYLWANSCSVPDGWVTNDQDCNDDNANVHPTATEVCDELDNNCDGLTDADDPLIVYDTFYRDLDDDGFGDINVTIEACEAPAGYVADSTDCDDNNNMVNPNFPEICDGIDNDCDDLVDADDPDLGDIEWHLDNDGDGYGDANTSLIQCSQPAGYTAFPGDCDDSDANNYPGNLEVCDGQDNNCDGVVDEDCLEDCDDISVYVNPIVDADYRAKEDLNSDAVTPANGDHSFYAGEEIDLNNGFEVLLGTVFLAAIQDCIDASSSVQNPIETYENYINRLGEANDGSRERKYIIKSEYNSVTRLFNDFNSMQLYANDLKSSNQKFKLYVFENGELVDKLMLKE